MHYLRFHPRVLRDQRVERRPLLRVVVQHAMHNVDLRAPHRAQDPHPTGNGQEGRLPPKRSYVPDPPID
eukprot:254888-Prorocentrum_minimum.AAC.1